jgi:hypothetical protein
VCPGVRPPFRMTGALGQQERLFPSSRGVISIISSPASALGLRARARGYGQLRAYLPGKSGAGPLPVKPPKCRHATHARLIAELIACENEARAVVGGMLAAMVQSRRGMETNPCARSP